MYKHLCTWSQDQVSGHEVGVARGSTPPQAAHHLVEAAAPAVATVQPREAARATRAARAAARVTHRMACDREHTLACLRNQYSQCPQGCYTETLTPARSLDGGRPAFIRGECGKMWILN